MKLSQGDMRRMLNILQACHAAHTVIDEDAIHACTGSPLPSDMNKVLEILLNSDITSAFKRDKQILYSINQIRDQFTQIRKRTRTS